MKELRFILIALTCIGLAIGLWLLIQGWSVGRGEEKGGWTSYPVTDQERARLLFTSIIDYLRISDDWYQTKIR